MSVTVTDATFQRDVLGSQKPVLVDFFTEWCAPCKPLAVSLDELAGEIGDKITIVKVNAEASPNATNKYGVRGFPTMLIFKGGEVAASRSGAMPKNKIREWIEQSI
jgi:thioredoxin 1